MKKLNLGCGEFKKVGYINLDSNPFCNPDTIHDLNNFPYPFKDNNFELIEASHVFEHLNEPFEVMKELHRILKQNGKLIIKVPHFSRGFLNSEHKRGLDVSFPLYFNKNFKGGYIGVKFELESLKLKWFAQPYLKRTFLPKFVFYIGCFIGFLIDLFANLSPYICSRLWCYWVGGFEEIEFVFRKK